VKDEYPMLISFSNIREGSLVVWCTVSCRVNRFKVFCAILPNFRIFVDFVYFGVSHLVRVEMEANGII
jgi:hypothetical protein